MKIKISDIKIGKRFRQDYGNVESLAESIKEHGQLVPIVIDKDMNLIDGGRRIAAKKILIEDFIDGVKNTPLSSNKEAESVSNSNRKQWDVVEAVAIWDSMEKKSGGSGGSSKMSDSDSLRRVKAVKITGWGHDTLSKAKQIINTGNETWINSIRKDGRVNSIYNKIKIAEARKEIEKLIPEKEIKGVYNVIVIDPPWKYDDTADPNENRGTCEYPTMSIEELKEINIPSDEDCVLWLWVTNSFMEEGYELLDAWGFENKTILTWNKVNKGMGNYLGNVTEHCIIATKGKPLSKGIIQNKDYKWSTLITEKRKRHSTKPEIFYKMVDEICAGRKLDYFARTKREGWDVYGDEVK